MHKTRKYLCISDCPIVIITSTRDNVPMNEIKDFIIEQCWIEKELWLFRNDCSTTIPLCSTTVDIKMSGKILDYIDNIRPFNS